jgi:hypothetical protein
MNALLQVKGGSGSGWFGPPKGTHLPSSEHIESEEQAKAYWHEHFGDKVFELTVYSKNYEINISAHFNPDNDHAYTETVHGQRVFSPNRARRMDGIFRVVAHPNYILTDRGAELFLEREEGGTHYCVVLKYRESRKRYEFASAYTYTSQEFQELRRKACPALPKGKASLRKGSEAFSAFQVFGASPGAVERPPVSALSAGGASSSGQDMVRSVAQLLWLIKATPAGARWITVHPHGKDEKGTPVLIQETRHGSGVYHVIGGAGGKLNYLKLRGVRSNEDYAQEVRQKQAVKREEQRRQVEREKELGLHESREKKRAAIREQVRGKEAEFVRQVAGAMGWQKEELELPAEKLGGLSEAAANKVRQKHHRELLRRAGEAVEVQRRAMVAQADERAQAELEGAEIESVSSRGPGYPLRIVERTRGKEEEIQKEAAAIDIERRTPEQQERAESASARALAIRKEVERADVAPVEIKARIVEAEQAAALLHAERALKGVRRQAREALGAVDRGEEKAFVLEVGSHTDDEAIQREVENDLRTLRTSGFLEEFAEAAGGKPESLGRHLAVGAYNALNGVALTTAGVGVLDRDAVDILGTAGAAQALAHRLRTDLSPEEYRQVRDAMEAYHVDHYMERAQEAQREARELRDAADEIALGEVRDGSEIAVAAELHRRKLEALAESRRVLGQALGEFEAHAALVASLRSEKPQPVKIPLGRMRTEDAVRRLRAVGLERGDYRIEHAGTEIIATIEPDGLLRITQESDPEHARAVADSLNIIEGRADDPNWWPEGVVRRPEASLSDRAPGVSPQLAEPFNPGPDLAGSVRGYIGGRMADGDAISDIVADLQSEALAQLVEPDRRGEYFETLAQVVPLTDASGKPIEHESRRADFERLADEFVRERYGVNRSPLHGQSFPVDQASTDALHRAFSAEPTGPAAFKPVGDLSPQERTGIRRYFDQHIAKADESTRELRATLDDHLSQEPPREVDDMFGTGTNPEWVEWKTRAEELREGLRQKGLDWARYTQIMGSPEAAYAAVQDHVRGKVAKEFAAAHNRLRPEAPLKLGRTVVREHLRHLDAVDPATRERRAEEHRQLLDRLRDRIQGRYATGGVIDKLDAARAAQAQAEQAQMGFFAAMPETGERPLAADERHTLGAAAEAQIEKLAGVVGQNFKPGQPVKLGQVAMSGRYINQQRAIKLVERNKRLLLAQGVGSGKTRIGLGAFAHLHATGKAKRGLFVVPSIVQGQFGAEALNVLDPGRFRWHAEPGAGRDQRLAAYRDADTHFNVVTHAALRDDLIHLGAKHTGVSESEMAAQLRGMSREDRAKWARETMAAAGMDHDFVMVDEGHDLLDRAGKPDSLLSRTMDAITDNVPHYVSASADPVKNDPSEIFSALQKMDPNRYRDRAKFMRRYGVDTLSSRDQLRREMARYIYPGRIDPGVRVHAKEHRVQLSEPQHAAIREVEKHVADLRLAHLEGKTNVAAARALSEQSFAGVPEAEHEAVARRLQRSVGVLRETAIARVMNDHPKSAKVDAISKFAAERKGKPGVVFARSRAAVQAVAERLRAEGHRVEVITGADSAKEKDAKRRRFRPDAGEPEADILVLSDAGAVGLNAQRGQWLVQYDVPLTAKVHAQRNGRIHRLGQKNDVELVDLVGDHPSEDAARKRLASKYQLREILTTPLEGLDDEGFAPYLRAAQTALEKAA